MDGERGGGGGGGGGVGEGARFSSSSSSQAQNNPNQNPNSYITSTTTPSSTIFSGLGSNQPPPSISSSSAIIQSGGGGGGVGGGGGGLMYLQHFNNGSSGTGMVSPSSISFNTVPRDSDGEQVKRKRGRPRRYTLDGSGGASGSGGGDRGNHHHHHQNNNSNSNSNNNNNHVGLGLSPFSSASPPPSSYSNNAPSSSDPASKRNRGRPPGTGKKQQLDSLGSIGVGFTPHVIAVKAGEDVASKIMSFSQQGPHAVCILSANGAISNVTLRQPAMYGGTVTYEGRFEIISLSGSFLLTESGSTRSRTGGMSVSLAGADGRVLGGGVAGILMAATPVQVVVGKFIVEEEKPKAEAFQREPSSALPPHMACFGTPVATASSPSQGASSESSDEEEEDDGSPLNRIPGAFNSTNQPIQNMSGYPSINWGPSHLSYPSRHDPNMNNLHN